MNRARERAGSTAGALDVPYQSFDKEEDFIRHLQNVEGEKPSKDLFWFLFEAVSIIVHNYCISKFMRSYL